MESYRKIVWGLVVIGILGALGLYFFYPKQPPETLLPAGQSPDSRLAPPPESQAVSEEKSPSILPPLRDSDSWLLSQARALSKHPQLLEWLKISNLIRRITAAVVSIAEGESPRPHLKFLASSKSFAVVQKGESLYLNPRGYHRYDLAADVFASLDAAATIRMFRELKPLFQEAYRELGYPDQDFDEALIAAIQELLEVPEVRGEIALEKGVLTYEMTDDRLENLSDAQKNLLRLGPLNARKVQDQLREMARALGVPETRLPKPRVYQTKRKS